MGQANTPSPGPGEKTQEESRSQTASKKSTEGAGTTTTDGKSTGLRIRKWFPVGQSFGPLSVQRIGGEWRDGKLGILLDASVDLFGLTVGLAGFALRVRPTGTGGLLSAGPKFNPLNPKESNIELGLEGLILACGSQGFGFCLSQAVGEIVADIIMKKDKHKDIADALSLSRFEKKYREFSGRWYND